MKKTILAIAIPALFASAANATVIYDKDGTTFDVYGRVQANYYGATNKADAKSTTGYSDVDAELKGASRLGWSGKVALNNTWSAIAKTEWQVAAENTDNANNGTFKARHIYAGFDGGQNGQVIFGQTDTAYYDAIAITDIMNEWGSAGNFYEGRQEGQIIYSNSFGGFKGKLSYQTNDDNAKIVPHKSDTSPVITLSNLKREYAYAAAGSYDFDFGLGLTAGYSESRIQDKTSKVKGDIQDWATGLKYSIGGAYFAGIYTGSELENKSTGAKEKGKGYELVASYNVDAWTVLAGYNRAEVDLNTGNGYQKAVSETLLGAQYSFTPKLKAYTEYKIQGIEKLDDEWTVAMQYNF